MVGGSNFFRRDESFKAKGIPPDAAARDVLSEALGPVPTRTSAPVKQWRLCNHKAVT